MQTISSSCYDAIIIKQENRLYKSTPFQVVFSNSLIKLIEKNKQKGIKPYELTLHVNDRKIDIPIKMDSTGRVVFEKVMRMRLSDLTESFLSCRTLRTCLTTNTLRNLPLLTPTFPRAKIMLINLNNIKTSKHPANSGSLPGCSTKRKMTILGSIASKRKKKWRKLI